MIEVPKFQLSQLTEDVSINKQQTHELIKKQWCKY